MPERNALDPSVTVIALLWAKNHALDALEAYERRALALAARHGGELLHAIRPAKRPDGPDELHVLRFPNASALARFMADPEREALVEARDAAIARADVFVSAQDVRARYNTG